jgi:hypothetical protein
VSGNMIFDQDNPSLDDAEALPSVDSTPRHSELSGTPRHAHALAKPSRKERRALKKLKRHERATIVGRHPKTTVLFVLLILLSPLWYSLGSAATDPALGPTVGSRLTEWVRGHGGGGIVTWAENTWYTFNAPPKGGKPAPGAIPKPTSTSTTVPLPTGPAHLAAPAAIVPFVSTPTPGEGQWHVVGRTVAGIPTTYAAYLRPNAVNTSLVSGVAWMDTKLLRAKLYAGSSIPGTGTFAAMAPITGAALTSLDAAFNSGFRMQDSAGGFFLDGIAAAPLVAGKASFVIDSAGNMNIGAWGTDVAMTPTTTAVRQNLALIVDHGVPVSGLNANDNFRWGATLGGRVQVWRSGVGVTASGALVYVGGSGLSIVDLANLLSRAGSVRAMELDINTAWVNFSSWSLDTGVSAAADSGTLLTFDQKTSPNRYFSTLSRDFFTMSVRPYSVPAARTHVAK